MQVSMHPETDRGTPIEHTGEAPVEPSETRAQLMRHTPAVDIFENKNELVIVTDLPGVARDAIELDVDGGTLSLSASDMERHRVYRRAFALPNVIDPAGVDAELRDGVLTVRLRKREDLKPRRIEIRSAG